MFRSLSYDHQAVKVGHAQRARNAKCIFFQDRRIFQTMTALAVRDAYNYLKVYWREYIAAIRGVRLYAGKGDMKWLCTACVIKVTPWKNPEDIREARLRQICKED